MQIISNDKTQSLPVMESFYTIQGEGYHQGRAAYFIRLGGCDVGCVWCDVKDSWDASKHPMQSVEEMVEHAKEEVGGFQLAKESKDSKFGMSDTALDRLSTIAHQSSTIAVITGGEPLMHDCGNLTKSLHGAGFRTHIETSGSHPLSGEWDWICLSPKKFKAPLPEILDAADELKIIVFNKSDFEWAEKYASLVSSKCRLFLQPEWSRSSVMTPLIIGYIKQNPQWEFSLQLHKYIHVP